MGSSCSSLDCCCCCCCRCCCCDDEPQIQRLPSNYVQPTTNESQRKTGRKHFEYFCITTQNISKLIDGYQNEPDVSLEEALKFTNRKIAHLPECIAQAKAKCNRSTKHRLTHDESAAIYLYSMNWEPSSLCEELKRAFDSGQRAQVKPWFKYLKLLKNALDKLPYAKTTIFQGTSYDSQLEEKLMRYQNSSNSMFSSGPTPLYPSLGSAVTSIDEIKDCLNGPSIILAYEPNYGRLVGDYTENNQMKVIIFPEKKSDGSILPGAKLLVMKTVEHQTDGSVFIHLTSKTSPPTPATPELKLETHFVCRNTNCGHFCRGKHKIGHCYGFKYLDHQCKHHCVLKNKCCQCGKHSKQLLQCNKCEICFCDDCCFQQFLT
ncbi:unnamed protein product [Adineta ricciae]|uniref:Uncharacterized protein n=1 Tax=Adineta ricciae TaxID=249248 RepID=A0A815Y463_ADIRI|nr:unnamed protein product [Adineta ricciae]CAF1565607.1 unnamed protein product [Adineta ricciae]